MMRSTLLRSLVLVGAAMLLVTACSDEPRSGPVTIESGFGGEAENGIFGPFRVTEGADTLGCSAGNFEDDASGSAEIVRVMTCSDSGVGTFTIAFDPDGYDTGPGELNGPWRITGATEDFSGVEGGGDWAGFENSETMTGEIEYSS